MMKLSTGDDSTLGNYRKLCAAVFGEQSGCTKFIDKKIAESKNGADEEVIADESQMMYVFAEIIKKEQKPVRGLYNMIHGENKYSDVIMGLIDVPKGMLLRYRDVYVKDGKAIVYTRNGGSNRDSADIKDVMEEITHHSLYVEDYDDKHDNTYAYIVFNVPDEFKDLAKEIEREQGEVLTIEEKFKRFEENSK